MRKALLMVFLFALAAFLPAVQMGQGMAVSAGLELQFDPRGDVYEMVDGEMESMVSGYDYLDILEISASIEPITGGEFLVFTMETVGSIVKDKKDISYVFIFGTSNGDSYVAFSNYSEGSRLFTTWLVNIETGSGTVIGPPTVPTISSVSATGGSLELKIRTNLIGSPASLDAFQAITLDNSREEKKIGDMAPDKLVRVTSPSDGATIWYGEPSTGTYIFSGVCRKSQNNFEKVEARIGSSSWIVAATGTDVTQWSISFDIKGLSGEQVLEVRATDSASGIFTDSIRFIVNNDYHSGTRPVIPGLPQMTIGDVYTYDTHGNPRLAGLDMTTTTSMEMRVEKLDDITYNGQETACVKVHTSQEGTVVLGAFDMEQTIERDSWRPVDSQQSVLKEYTETAQSLTKDGDPLNTMYTFTNMTYNQVFNPGYEGKTVGAWWAVSSAGKQDTTTVDADGNVESRSSTPSKTMFQEVLATTTVTKAQVPPIPSSQTGFLVKSSNGDNESAYSIMTFVKDFPVPVMIDAYDNNREKIGSLYLTAWTEGSGIFAEIADVQWPSALSAGDEYVFNVEVQNQGEKQGAVWASLHIDGAEVDKQTITLASGASGTIELSWTPAKEGKYVLEIRTADSSKTMTLEVEAAETPEDDMTMIAIAVAGLAAVVLVVVALKRKGSKSGEEPEPESVGGDAKKDEAPSKSMSGVSISGFEIPDKKKDAVSKPVASAMEEVNVKCGKCGSTTKIAIESKPHLFKCPDCGAKLLIR